MSCGAPPAERCAQLDYVELDLREAAHPHVDWFRQIQYIEQANFPDDAHRDVLKFSARSPGRRTRVYSAANTTRASGFCWFAACSGGVLYGYALFNCHTLLDGQPAIYLDDMGILPSAQRCNVGVTLLSKALRRLAYLYPQRVVWTKYEVGNAAARRMYVDKFGGTLVGVPMDEGRGIVQRVTLH
jgi:ribosomal protein S18 acetylase RimI-like enzyme